MNCETVIRCLKKAIRITFETENRQKLLATRFLSQIFSEGWIKSNSKLSETRISRELARADNIIQLNLRIPRWVFSRPSFVIKASLSITNSLNSPTKRGLPNKVFFIFLCFLFVLVSCFAYKFPSLIRIIMHWSWEGKALAPQSNLKFWLKL